MHVDASKIIFRRRNFEIFVFVIHLVELKKINKLSCLKDCAKISVSCFISLEEVFFMFFGNLILLVW